ncbi:MAG: Holliday junction resolvase RuvX [Rhodospirillaceae bacterium]|jgi:putative Holliday junction resolvase
MICETLDEFLETVPAGSRLIGLDVGSKTIGIAVSDSARAVATSVETIRRTKFSKDVVLLKDILAERDAGGIFIGLPVSMDGTEGPACQSVRQFAANLAEEIDLPIAFWDERLSTSAIERFLVDEADMSRKRRGEVVDKMAAAYILQGALDALRNLSEG